MKNIWCLVILLLVVLVKDSRTQNVDFYSIIQDKVNYKDSINDVVYLGEIISEDSSSLYILNHSHVFTSSGRTNHRIWIFNRFGSLGYYLFDNEEELPVSIVYKSILVFSDGVEVDLSKGLPRCIMGFDLRCFTNWEYPYSDYPRDW